MLEGYRIIGDFRGQNAKTKTKKIRKQNKTLHN